MKERYKLALIFFIFIVFYFLPIENQRFTKAIFESLALAKWYAQEHVLLCLVPAFFIAGAIAVFVNKASVMKYFGAKANKVLSYGVAAISGSILAVCSCTILPLFMSIYQRGVGLGPAIAFLYSGPAINVLAIILTARVLGWDIGIARAVGAVLFSVIIGLLMHLIFLKEEKKRQSDENFEVSGLQSKPLYQVAMHLFFMIGLLIFANWGRPQEGAVAFWWIVYNLKWILAIGFFTLVLIWSLKWFNKDELVQWVYQTWYYAYLIIPLLFIGVLVAGFLFGRVGHEGIVPSEWVYSTVGDNSLQANLIASIVGTFMYFATLTEVPIIQGLLGAGMGKGPALAMLLAGPALSLPSMIVIMRTIGFKKTAVYVSLVIIMATISGMIFGAIV
ncbi:permease [Thermodesulfovibrio sp. 1176]|uniref:permease n=1 Tax=Thermodesulfovibrio sp. 1176 TaxID=3043424 RepID=UPI0024828B3F|nr:permease [Thermodesulfovibrio sp. 1176]MDI1471031.1 permease [Thermodesulfovibrio sp. 1176]